MSLRRALALLDARQEERIELGLGRVRRHLERLGSPHRAVPAFHVAGTNGKGSTCAILDAVLREAGLRVGLYTSPHLHDVRERVRVDGLPIPARAFARLLERAAAAEGSSRLTYFELTTSIAFQWFSERACDVAVLETGLGGRLDATNVVEEPLAAVVTSVGFDHQALLGKTLARIAAEKAGVFKPGRPAVFPDGPLLRRLARGRPVPVRRAWAAERVDWGRGRQVLRSPRGRRYGLSLLGAAQGMNCALARAAVEASGLPVPEAAWRRGLSRVRWPARFEVLRLPGGRTAVVDGAHNPDAASCLARTWSASPWSRGPALWVLGLLRDKDREGFLRPLARHLGEVVVTRPPSPRALDPLELAAAVRRAAPRARVTVETSPERAAAAWRRRPGAPRAAVFSGSLYLAGAARLALGARP